MIKSSNDIELGKFILHPQDLTKEIDTAHGRFIIKLLSPSEKRALIRKIAQETGAPIESLSETDYVYVVATCTVRMIVVEAPDWWKGSDSCRDEELLLQLYTEYKEMEAAFQRRLRSGEFDTDSEKSTAGRVDNK